MGRRAGFSPDPKFHNNSEDHFITDDSKAREQETQKPPESSFALARAIAKWVLISLAVMMAVGYLVEALDSKASVELETDFRPNLF